MDIKDQWQVCSLELSKRLKELGYSQKGVWYWQYNGKEGKRLGIGKYKLIAMDGAFGISKRDCVAPSVAELGMALPYRLRLPDDDYWLQIFKEDDFWEIRYFAYKEGIPLRVGHKEFSFQADTEANARGLMWEYLKKNGLLKDKNVEK